MRTESFCAYAKSRDLLKLRGSWDTPRLGPNCERLGLEQSRLSVISTEGVSLTSLKHILSCVEMHVQITCRTDTACHISQHAKCRLDLCWQVLDAHEVGLLQNELYDLPGSA